MKHGRRIWEKKMTQSVSHNKAQLMNQVTDLITHGRITTTVPKAKILKHYAEQIVNIAKEDNLRRMRKSVFQPDVTIPKLQLLAARYKDKTGGYTRLTLDGYNRAGSDRAPLATVEYVDNQNDSIHFLAQKYLPKVKEDLKEIQNRKYNTEEITLEDPMNPGTLVTAYRRTLRSDVNSKQIKQLAVKERYLQNVIDKFERSLVTYKTSRVYELEYLKTVETKNEAKALSKLRLLQEQVDSMDAKDRGNFVISYNEQNASKDSSRVLKMDSAGDLFWEKSESQKLAELAAASTAQSVAAPQRTEKATEPVKSETASAAPTKGAVKMIDRMMKFFRS